MPSSNESNAQQESTFKPQLDRAAVDQREREQDSKLNPIVEKITEFIPSAGKVLAPLEKPKPKELSEVPGPPERPQHDNKIEDFIRHQHRSTMPGGDLSTTVSRD
ncbi:hypothetical protein NOR_07635 [Metarhizium rileyi]|uniref:Uncharacterized protein n=1 Tax=Metarhizium rileyi (strain RCEF 4871) TaxID=1649241 RepID=A0A166XX57_METRR|nr:hypothetical protein NOR_07635 [Metarhizium rileyi RCEF 4871]TWU72108.1 hypothetical protein ED733_001593 [Metarhizium rileyi]